MGDISLEAGLSLGLATLAAIAWFWRQSARINEIHNMATKLVEMHMDPNSLFSTLETNRLLSKNIESSTRLFKDLIHYTKSGFEAGIGKALPPPEPEPD
jgi:hypothetical protein